MRADRLLSLLMLLQTRGRMTAATLADELGVSVRTVYRDIDGLCTAGVPVYTEHGPGGGVELLESYRTTLTGMKTDEVQALFMLSIPQPLEQLGVSNELRAALLKLSASLSDAQARQQAWTRQRVHLDSTWWFQSGEPVGYLPVLQEAVWNDRCVWVRYRLNFAGEIERELEALGLVAKAGVWYLVCRSKRRHQALRVSSLLEVHMLEEGFERDPDFDLAAFWSEWCTATEALRQAFQVQVRLAPSLWGDLPRFFGSAVSAQLDCARLDARGWAELTLPFESLDYARGWLLSCGAAVEVLDPEPLRLSILDYASQVVNFYQQRQNGSSA